MARRDRPGLAARGFAPYLLFPGYFARALGRQVQLDAVFYRRSATALRADRMISMMAAPGTLSSVLFPIHRAGWPFVAAFLAAAVLLGLLWGPLFWLGLLATAWCAYFFRDPVRVTPDDPALIVSPADGLVVTTAERVPPPELELGDRPCPASASS